MKKQGTVVLRKQNQNFEVCKVDNLGLDYLQKAVGGNVDLICWVPEFERLRIDMWINDDGKITPGFSPTFIAVDKNDNILDMIFGDVVFTSVDDEGNTVGLNDIQIQTIKNTFKATAILDDNSIVSVLRL